MQLKRSPSAPNTARCIDAATTPWSIVTAAPSSNTAMRTSLEAPNPSVRMALSINTEVDSTKIPPSASISYNFTVLS
jgi:hypothetical protein